MTTTMQDHTGQIDTGQIDTGQIDTGEEAGRWTDRYAETAGSVWVEVTPFRAQLRHLLDASRLPLHHLAARLGVSTPMCARILRSPQDAPIPIRKRDLELIPGDIGLRILACDAAALCTQLRRHSDAEAARLAITSLLERGHRITTLERVTGLDPLFLAALADGEISECSGRIHAALHAALVWAETNPGLRQRAPESSRPALCAA